MESKINLPQNLEAERAVLGAMMRGREAILTATEILLPASFYDRRHQVVYQAILDCHQEGVVDLPMLASHMAGNGSLDTIGGVPALIALLQSVATSANVEYHAGLVRQAWNKRRLLDRCYRTIEGIGKGQEIEDCTAGLQKELKEVTAGGERSGFQSLAFVVPFIEARIEANATGQQMGYPCGVDLLNAASYGLQPSELVVIGGRPATGKSAFGLFICHHLADIWGHTPVDKPKPKVAIISAEMSKETVAARLLSQATGISGMTFRGGEPFTENEKTSLVNAAVKLRYLPILLEERAPQNAVQLEGVIDRLMSLEPEVKVLMLDYIQLIARSGASEERIRIGDCALVLKAACKRYNLCLLCLSQTRRDMGDDPNHIPRQGDLFGSGILEQAADVIVLLHTVKPDSKLWPKMIGRYLAGIEPKLNEDEVLLFVNIDKNRNAICKSGLLASDRRKQSFRTVE